MKLPRLRAEGALRLSSRQKPRFLTAVYGVMSDEIAAGNFIQIKNTRVLESPAP